MARARKAATTSRSPRSSSGSRSSSSASRKTASTGSAGKGDTLVCPECGKEFSRPASLGAHRNRAHGVVGASARRAATQRTRSGSNTRGRNGTQATRQSARTRGGAGSSDGARRNIDRDALLQTLFPSGVPAREDVIRQVSRWLDEAERLAAVK